MFIYRNTNPNGSNVGDCVIRALSIALNKSWDDVYLELMQLGFQLKDMPSANYVWGAYLLQQGFKRYPIADTCPACYTVNDFCEDNPNGIYILGTGTHVICAINGDYYDSWDSGNEVPVFVFKKGR